MSAVTGCLDEQEPGGFDYANYHSKGWRNLEPGIENIFDRFFFISKLPGLASVLFYVIQWIQSGNAGLFSCFNSSIGKLRQKIRV